MDLTRLLSYRRYGEKGHQDAVNTVYSLYVISNPFIYESEEVDA